MAACNGAPESVALDTDSLAGVVDLQIGVLDGPAPYVFGRISGIVEDHLGRIFVSDHTANEIRVFSSEGDFQFSIGRAGSGPGELRGPCCLAFAPDGTLWIRDGGNRRYVGYSVTADRAEPRSTLRMAHSDGWHNAPLSFTAEGELVDTGYRISPTGSADLQRFYLRESGLVLRSFPIQEPAPEELGTVVSREQLSTLFFPQPFGPEFLVAYGPDAIWAAAVSSRYHITGYASGVVIWTVTDQTPEGPTLSAEDLVWAQNRIAAYIQNGGGARADYPQVPDRKPPLAALMFDQVGRLWVSFNTPAPEHARANVYDRTGGLVGERTWPREVNLAFPAWLGADHAVGIATDTLGVQRIARVVW
jgi:hypothetical protein